MDEHGKLVIKATYAAIATSFVIIISKIIAWYITESSTVLASLADSVLDITASSVNFIAAKYAFQPPDDDHRFGHGKAEDFAVLAQSTFFIISSIFIIVLAAQRIIEPQHVEHGEVGLIIMAVSIIFTLVLISYQNHVIKKTGSKIIKSDKLHYSIDTLSNIAVIVALGLSEYFNNKYIDPIFAIGIALYMMYGAQKLLRRAFKNLMDHEMDDKDKAKIITTIESEPKVRGFHDLKTRYSGHIPVIQFHIELDGKMDLFAAHEIASKLEIKIANIFKNAQVIIHQDPAGVEEKIEFVE